MITIESIKFSPNHIGWWYLGMVTAGRADKVFYANQHDLQYALTWAKQCNHFWGAFSGDNLIGVGFVENEQFFKSDLGELYRAELGFGFMPNCTVFEALEAGRKMLDASFAEGYTDLFGTTPEHNLPALAYAKRLGLKLYGPVPNFCHYLGLKSGVYTSHISREEWNKLKDKQR